MNFYSYWGKANKNDDYHLLVYHCLDVAAVGKVWMEHSPGFVKRGAEATGLTKSSFVEWTIFFLTLHDIGKFDVRFQNLRSDIFEKLKNRKCTDVPYHPRHDQRGYAFYKNHLIGKIKTALFGELISYPILERYLDVWAEPSFGHHGIPPRNDGVRKTPPSVLAFVEKVQSLFVSKLAIDEVKTLLERPKNERKVLVSGAKQFSWQLAGAVTLCDWIASGDDAFTFCSEEIPLEEYFNGACKKAKQGVERAEIVSTPLSKKQGMKRLFPQFADSPTPLQRFCDQIPVAGEPQLWILEDVTGAGKTEAALTLASRILGAGGGTGCFVALPTMATSNAMYERMANVYSLLYNDGSCPSLTLSHGSRHLSDRFRNSYSNQLDSIPHDSEFSDQDRDESKTHCSQWLADSSKKALLADVGVGTVDQILMAGLPVRYQALRAFGMSQKVLIVDEVHAFDAYMLRLLENIITAQAAFGGSVILLSATLPFSVREKFCQAFSVGLGTNHKIEEKDLFPLVTSVTADKIQEIGVETRELVAREVGVEFCESVDEVFSLIEQSVSDGKCVCWIRNTINDVMISFEELQKRGIKTLDMFHSRFALANRLSIEKRILKRFGPDSTGDERRKQVLIASQVVEQSLDLDFDVMISDLAPIDLLIQRAGRLHRHDRKGRGKPVFYVHTPMDTEQPKSNWYAEAFPGAKWVYKDTALLWRTKEILKKQKRLKMPEEARNLIESVYGTDGAIETPKVFIESQDEAWADQMNQTSLGNFNRLKFEQGYCRMSSDANKWESDERVSTRLSDPTNRLYFCRWTDGKIVPLFNKEKYSWDLSSLSLRKSALNQIDYDDEIQVSITNLQKQSRFKYDTLFLVFQNDELELSGIDEYGRAVLVRYNRDTGLVTEREGK